MRYKAIPRLWKVTRNNEFIADLTPEILSGRVSFNPDRTVKWSFEADVLSTISLKPFTEYIAPFLRIEYEDGHVEESQFGVYTTVPPKQAIAQTHQVTILDCRDLTWILANSIFTEGYTLVSGANIATTVRTLINDAGFTRHRIPTQATTNPYTKSWKAGASRLQVINDLLNMAGMYTLFMDKQGYLSSLPYVADRNKAPSVTYDTTKPSRVKVIRTIERDTTPDRIANQILVIGGTPDAPIISTRKNTSPNSPTSIAALGMTISKTYEGALVADQAAADAMAQRLLDTASQEYHRLTIHTSHDVTMQPYDVYRLNIVDSEGETVVNGVWNSRGWSMGFTNDEQMTHEMSNIDEPAMEVS